MNNNPERIEVTGEIMAFGTGVIYKATATLVAARNKPLRWKKECWLSFKLKNGRPRTIKRAWTLDPSEIDSGKLVIKNGYIEPREVS